MYVIQWQLFIPSVCAWSRYRSPVRRDCGAYGSLPREGGVPWPHHHSYWRWWLWPLQSAQTTRLLQGNSLFFYYNINMKTCNEILSIAKKINIILLSNMARFSQWLRTWLSALREAGSIPALYLLYDLYKYIIRTHKKLTRFFLINSE